MLDMNQQDDREFAALVGIDWADQKHAWTLHSFNASEVEGGELDHTTEAVEGWAAELARRFAGRSIAVALEQSRGALRVRRGLQVAVSRAKTMGREQPR